MADPQYRELLRAPGVSLGDFRCRGGPRGCISEERALADEVVFVRRGLFARCGDRTSALADPTSATLMVRGQAFRIDHPLPGGDHCTVISLGRRFWEEGGLARRAFLAAAAPQRPVAVDAAIYLEQWRLLEAAGGNRLEALEIGERLVGVIDAVLRANPADGRHDRRIRPATVRRYRRLVSIVVELLNAEYDRPLTLAGIAAQAHCSPYQLCRIFRRAQGTTIHAYLNRLRLRAALARLRAGSEVARAGLDLGFATPSHFAAAFRREYGVSPSQARRALRAGAKAQEFDGRLT